MGTYRKFRKWAWITSAQRLDQGPHITRYSMYRRLEEAGKNLPRNSGRVLTISRSENLIELLGIQAQETINADYPEHNLLALDFEDESFDFILSDQVLEHIEGSPQQAIDECHRILRPGGIVLHTTCFINPVHEWPNDFWRFTPEALSLLHKDWSNILEVGGWGNPEAWPLIQDGLRFVGVPHATWHPLHKAAVRNDKAWPIVTWIVAEK